jgi:FixJ family two-component response regulator
VPKTPKLIVIVDDDASVRRALGRLIGAFGFEVVLLDSARACLDGTAVDRAVCLICDVSMPGMDGFELSLLLNAAGRSVPTVFVSAHDDESYRRQAHALGSIAFLSKPYDENLLYAAIDKAIAPDATASS